MGDIIYNVNIENLEEGKVFDKDELIIQTLINGFVTIRREPDSKEIRYFNYDFYDVHDGFVHYNGHGEIYPGEPYYKEYKSKLEEVGLW